MYRNLTLKDADFMAKIVGKPCDEEKINEWY
jgi:hypothetical protein